MSKCVESIQNIFSQVLYREVQSPQVDLFETGLLDSMGLVELLFNLEQQFGFQPDIGNLDLDQFRSIESIANLVESSRAGLAS
ncbi:MAG TPA: phosphopantetheine-binding protein [Bryobacteraceae bacterium]|jgi:D-alanine--poly(phosphoribitol) ligase subunit 2|nr:phosphopantetheine-binding protein [Bryobacteraceae bacterium]